MPTKRLLVHHLASRLTRYKDGLKLQEKIASNRRAGDDVGDHLLLLQHHPVYTIGKRGSQADFLVSREELTKEGVDIEEVPRGGEVTFHGPGQLVVYPIIGLRDLKLGARAWVEGLEECIVDVAAMYGVQARGQVPGRTGVWVQERKLAALGVQISRGVSTHGMALNVNTDLAYFSRIVPCGLPDKEVTSLRSEAYISSREARRAQKHRAPEVPAHAVESICVTHVAEQLARIFASKFGYWDTKVLMDDDDASDY